MQCGSRYPTLFSGAVADADDSLDRAADVDGYGRNFTAFAQLWYSAEATTRLLL